MAKIGDVCASKIDTLNAAYNGKIDYIDISAVDNDKKKITNTETLQIKEAPSRARQLVECDDIIVSLVRPNLNAVAVVENSSENLQVASTGYCVLRCNQAVYSRYLFYFCQSETFINRMTAQATGASYPAVSNSIVKNCEIPLPERNKQKEIADILDKVTGLISLRKQQLAKLDELVKARFVEMFGDAKLNPNNLPCCSLSEYIVFLTSGSRGWSQYFTDSGEYFITIKNVKNCKITLQDVQCVTPPDNAEAKRTRVQENDLLISITADLGRTGIVTKKIAEHGAYINQHLTCIRLKQDKLNPLYVAYYMESDAGKEQFIAKNQSAVKAGLNFNAINSLKLMVPPLALQNQFAAFVERVDQQKQTIQQSIEKLELMKKALMQEYFG